MKNKKTIISIILVVLVILILLVIFIFGKTTKKDENVDFAQTSAIQENEQEEQDVKEEVVEEQTENETKSEKEEIDKPSETENTLPEENYIGEEERQSSNENQINGKSEEERAIDLVKEEYGEVNNVSFNIAHREGENCIISVVDPNGVVLQWYTVNLNTNEVSLYE